LQQRKRRVCPTWWESTLGPRRRGIDCPQASARAKRVVRRYYQDVLSGGRLDFLDELLAPGFVGHDSAGATIDLAGFVAGVRGLVSAFENLDISIDDQVAEGGRVSTRWSAVGTHTGAYAGIAPTGREVIMAGTDIHRLEGDRVVELWEQVDFAGLLAQLL
jgi:predicted ester cyclase